MPFVKGNELATRIKQVAPQQPVLMITAFQHKPSRDNPVDAVVSKPFNTAHLQEVMAQLLNVAASRQPQYPLFECAENVRNLAF
jgi:CheY-like chemotaxis protein